MGSTSCACSSSPAAAPPRRPEPARTAALFLALACTAGAGGAAPARDPLVQGYLAFEQREDEAALAPLREAAKSPADAAKASLLLGSSLGRLQRWPEAESAFKEALKLRPSDPDAAVGLGLVYYHTGRWPDAKRQFERAAKARPGHARALCGLGMVLAGEGDWAAAREKFEGAVKASPRQRGAWVGLSDSLVRLGRLEAAAKAREKALDLDDEDPELNFRQAALLYSLDDIPGALRALRKASLAGRAEAHLLEGMLEYRQGDLKAATAAFRSALELDEASLPARLNLGIGLYDQELYGEAITQFEAALRAHPGSAQAAAYLKTAREMACESALRKGSQAVLEGNSLEGLRRWEEALGLSDDRDRIERMLEGLRKSQAPRAAALAAAGDRAYRSDKLEAALGLWSDALQIDPEQTAAKQGFERAKGQLSRLKRALRASLEQALGRQDLEGAQRWASKLAALDPAAGKEAKASVDRARQKAWRALVAKGEAALERGDPAEALQAYRGAQALAGEGATLGGGVAKAEKALRRKAAGLLAQAGRAADRKQPEAAYKAYQAVLALDPGHLKARQESERLAGLLKLRRGSGEAIDRLYHEGVFLYAEGKTKEALAVWQRGAEAAPGHKLIRQAIRTAELKLKGLAALGEQG